MERLGGIPAAIPNDEDERLRTLRSYEILDSLPEDVYDDLAFLASVICQTPIALVSFVDEKRQFLKANVGLLPARETPRDIAFCAHAILETDVFVVNDASKDARFAENPLVIGEPKIRFYAGVQLRTPEGQPIGTICALDRTARELSTEQRKALAVLARQVMAQLELRRVIIGLEGTLPKPVDGPSASSTRPPPSPDDIEQAAQRARALLGQGTVGGPMGERIRALLERYEALAAAQRTSASRALVLPADSR